MILWWSGRGYLVPVIVMASACLFGFAAQAVAAKMLNYPWFWGITLIIDAPILWIVGNRANARRGVAPPRGLKSRLNYRARHRFMSLPMEVWGPILRIIGALGMISGLMKLV